ncbi:MAG: hypothetical protein WC479_10530 [Candidatus Izemoplasmatales bacterium]|jgi:hypothetical protein
MINHDSEDSCQTVYILTELEISMKSQNDTSLGVIGVFSSYDKALTVKKQKVYEKDIEEKCYSSNFEVKNSSFCYEKIGDDGYFYQLLIIEHKII